MTTPSFPRPQPVPTPETLHYWEGTALGELRLQRCRGCDATYFPPQPFCPACASDDIEIVRSSGRGSLYSYVITHRRRARLHRAVRDRGGRARGGSPAADEPRGVEPDPEVLALDLPVEVVFETVGEIALPMFRPSTA